jgi:hypothetical protein
VTTAAAPRQRRNDLRFMVARLLVKVQLAANDSAPSAGLPAPLARRDSSIAAIRHRKSG